MFKVDLSWLISRKSLIVLYTLSRNGCRANTTALGDTRVNAFTLLATKCARKIFEISNTLLKTLERPIPIKGHNRQIGRPITLILQIHL